MHHSLESRIASDVMDAMATQFKPMSVASGVAGSLIFDDVDDSDASGYPVATTARKRLMHPPDHLHNGHVNSKRPGQLTQVQNDMIAARHRHNMIAARRQQEDTAKRDAETVRLSQRDRDECNSRKIALQRVADYTEKMREATRLREANREEPRPVVDTAKRDVETALLLQKRKEANERKREIQKISDDNAARRALEVQAQEMRAQETRAREMRARTNEYERPPGTKHRHLNASGVFRESDRDAEENIVRKEMELDQLIREQQALVENNGIPMNRDGPADSTRKSRPVKMLVPAPGKTFAGRNEMVSMPRNNANRREWELMLQKYEDHVYI